MSMVPATRTSADLYASNWAGTVGRRAGCQQLGTLDRMIKTKCQPLEWDWGPIYLCCSTGASVGV